MPRYIDAVAEIEKATHKLEFGKITLGEYEDLIRPFRKVLTADADVAEVKHGKWIVQDKGIIVTSYRCSECGRVVRDDTWYDVTVDYPYCHCGAKMDEGEE